jgi:hypothetical protein
VPRDDPDPDECSRSLAGRPRDGCPVVDLAMAVGERGCDRTVNLPTRYAIRSAAEGAQTPAWLAALPADGPVGGSFHQWAPVAW